MAGSQGTGSGPHGSGRDSATRDARDRFGWGNALRKKTPQRANRPSGRRDSSHALPSNVLLKTAKTLRDRSRGSCPRVVSSCRSRKAAPGVWSGNVPKGRGSKTRLSFRRLKTKSKRIGAGIGSRASPREVRRYQEGAFPWKAFLIGRRRSGEARHEAIAESSSSKSLRPNPCERLFGAHLSDNLRGSGW